jgi:hypothetical protein
MAKPEISEFSYGYAFTDELIHTHHFPLVAAPEFPSLYREGQPGGGWDVRLDGRVPIFIQFKLADHFKTVNAAGGQCRSIKPPFYRMKIYNASKQHNMLLQLQNNEDLVYYAAPSFHKFREFTNAYMNREVLKKSLMIKPNILGNTYDKVAFNMAPGRCECCLLPGMQVCNPCFDFGTFSRDIEAAYSDRADEGLSEQRLNDIERVVIDILRQNDIDFESLEDMNDLSVSKRIALYLLNYMNVHFFTIRERTPNENSQ